MFQDLDVRFQKLLRVTPGKHQFWEAHDSNCWSFHRACGKAAVSCDTTLIASTNDCTVRLNSYLLLQLKGTEDFLHCTSD